MNRLINLPVQEFKQTKDTHKHTFQIPNSTQNKTHQERFREKKITGNQSDKNIQRPTTDMNWEITFKCLTGYSPPRAKQGV